MQGDAVETGLALMVIGIDSVPAPTLTPWLVNRFGDGFRDGLVVPFAAAVLGVLVSVGKRT
ncbi:hypothetical protein EV646_105288 [Kribbella antiqua]|uniref:Uncharacterized protein n=1 Tax=Kribbella antiqua TaxID=2512217 RepID=A0A4R2IT64_9ACTN|nr:hypothetical protein EV646_105288 [Kribbella antiqua]